MMLILFESFLDFCFLAHALSAIILLRIRVIFRAFDTLKIPGPVEHCPAARARSSGRASSGLRVTTCQYYSSTVRVLYTTQK